MIYNNFNSINIDNKIMIIENKEKNLNNYLLILTVLENGTFSTEIIEKQYFLTWLIENNFIKAWTFQDLQHDSTLLKEITGLQYKELQEDTSDIKAIIELNGKIEIVENSEKTFNEFLNIL